ncbi:MAG: NUDIX domain-containing protein, partial [Stellaceae bacterium]
HGVAFWAVNETGAVLLRRRPPSGLLGGMMEVPSTPWRARPWGDDEAKKAAPLKARWHRLPGTVAHGFTHFDLDLVILAGAAKAAGVADGVWVAPDRIADQALPSVMKKVIARAQSVASTA